MWNAAAVLQYVLGTAPYLKQIPAPVHWPTLALALSTSSQLRRQGNRSFLANSAQGRIALVRPLREALVQHEAFISALRGPKGITKALEHPLLSALLDALKAQAAALRAGFDSLPATAATEVVAAIAAGATNIANVELARVGPPSLRNNNNAPPTQFSLFGGSFAGYWQPNPLLRTFVPVEGADTGVFGGGPDVEMLVVLVSSLTRVPSIDDGRQEAAVTSIDTLLYGTNIGNLKMSAGLCQDYGGFQPAVATEPNPVDATAYLNQANGKNREAGTRA